MGRNNYFRCIDRGGNTPLFFMVNYTDIYALKEKLYKLKHELYREYKSPAEKDLAHKYLNEAINYVNELQLY